ncbi:MAG: hypothetical protein HY719_03415 [Planctomycetes bacterium]|nr:hypothetical protein [Planctomycetota bacterium]
MNHFAPKAVDSNDAKPPRPGVGDYAAFMVSMAGAVGFVCWPFFVMVVLISRQAEAPLWPEDGGIVSQALDSGVLVFVIGLSVWLALMLGVFFIDDRLHGKIRPVAKAIMLSGLALDLILFLFIPAGLTVFFFMLGLAGRF